MMGLGSYSNGGSSLPSSNLSALAPPFSVDRSNPRPNSNPVVNFSESPYGVPFPSPFQNWQYSRPSASTPDFCSNQGPEVDSIRTSYLPYSGSSPTSHVPPLNPNSSAATGTDTFTFLQYSSGIPSSHVGAKPYYTPFVSAGMEDDIPLVALHEPSYGLSSTSRAPLDGVDYTQSLSGLEYMPQWGSSWNRLSDMEQGQRMGFDGSFSSEEKNIADVCKNLMKKADGLRKCEEASVVSSRKYVDVLGAKSQIVSPSTGKLNDKAQDPRFISGESSRISISGSSTTSEFHLQGPFAEPAAKFWNHQMSYGTPYDEFFQPLDSCVNGCISGKKRAPALVIRPPSVGSSPILPNAVLTEGEKKISKVVADEREDFGFHDSSKQKEPNMPPSNGKESRPNLHGERIDHFFVASSSSGKEKLANKPVTKNVLDCMSKPGMEFQLPDSNVADGFTLALDSARAFTSVEDSSENLDHCNPSVDSPCWKGAPASRYSQSEVSEPVTAQHFIKRFEACNSLNLQQSQSVPPCTDDSVKVYQENGYVELGSLLCPERLPNNNFPATEHGPGDDVKTGFNNPKLSSSKGVQFHNDIKKPRQEYGIPSDSKCYPELKPANTKELDLNKRKVKSERDLKLYTDVVGDTGLNTNDASGDGSVPLHVMESSLCLPCPAENVSKLAKVDATESAPIVNVQMMINTIHNLSELLLFYCSNDASAVLGKDHEAIKHAINNLDACLSNKIEQMTPTRESMFPQQGAYNEPNLRKGATAARSPVMKEADASSHAGLDHHYVYEGKRNTNPSGKKIEKCQDFVPLRDDADSIKDDKMVQAIKELLKEDFNGEEEIQSESLLYKNLWLEAEAALCSINYRARFNRMKIEMEKCKSDNVKDVVETTRAAEKLPSSKVSPEPNLTQKVTPEVKDNPMSDDSIQDSSISTTTKIVEDVEASVMARFNILQRRGQSSSSVNAEGRRLTEVVDAGLSDKRNHLAPAADQADDGSWNASDELHSQYSGGNSKIDEFGPYIGSSQHGTVREFHVCATDDHAIQSGRSKWMGSRILSGWCDSSSSDWEHVLKDEFAGQK